MAKKRKPPVRGIVQRPAEPPQRVSPRDPDRTGCSLSENTPSGDTAAVDESLPSQQTTATLRKLGRTATRGECGSSESSTFSNEGLYIVGE